MSDTIEDRVERLEAVVAMLIPAGLAEIDQTIGEQDLLLYQKRQRARRWHSTTEKHHANGMSAVLAVLRKRFADLSTFIHGEDENQQENVA